MRDGNVNVNVKAIHFMNVFIFTDVASFILGSVASKLCGEVIGEMNTECSLKFDTIDSNRR